jgi:hypothetical protein
VTYTWHRKPYGADNVMLIEGIDDTHISCFGFPTVNRFAGVPVNGSTEIVRSMIYRVPVDDESTLLYFFRCYPDPKKSFITTTRMTELGKYDMLEKDWWGINVNDQDRMAVEQQGVIADRTNEHLGVSDGGIILMRQMMREALTAVAAGKDPLGVIRKPEDQMIDFPQKSDMLRDKADDDAVNYTAGFYKPAAE